MMDFIILVVFDACDIFSHTFKYCHQTWVNEDNSMCDFMRRSMQSVKRRRPHMKGQISVRFGKNVVEELYTEICRPYFVLVNFSVIDHYVNNWCVEFIRFSACLTTIRVGSSSGILLRLISYSHRPVLMFCFYVLDSCYV
jgi:hypothetical protein